MIRRNIFSALVCLLFSAIILAGNAAAWNFKQAAFAVNQEDLTAPKTASAHQIAKTGHVTKVKRIYKVKPGRTIVKCRPDERYGQVTAGYPFRRPRCVLPIYRPKGWELSAELAFARIKGKVRYYRGNVAYSYQAGYHEDVDMNDDLKVPEHGLVPTFRATYRFRPRWAFRYSIMPMVVEQSGYPNRSFAFGTHTFNTSQQTKVKWERIVQRMGMVYDPVRTYRSRISIFGDYVRLDDKLSVIDVMCCSETMDNDLNMAMAGLEFEKCLKTGRLCNTLSIECKAGIAFGDDGIGSDMMTGLKYSIPLNNGRWGYVKGGYRFATFKKKFSDARMFDTAMEGAIVQMGFVF